MAGLNLLTLLYIISNVYIAQVLGIIRSDCPVGCECKFVTKTVKCFHGNWNELPPLPQGTQEVHIKGGNFGRLAKPKACQSYFDVILLDLYDNGIRDIADDMFQCIPNLRILKTDENTFHNFPNVSICNLKNLKTLTLEMFSSVPFSIFDNLECFRSLKNLANVDLMNIRDGIYQPIAQELQPLKHVSRSLSLRYCSISSLMNDTFMGFRLQILDLSSNKISYIPENTFNHLINLTTLKLGHNRIKDTYGWFDKLSVGVIYFGNNDLDKLPHLSSSMHEVHLNGFEVSSLTSYTFAHLDKLKILDLSLSRIEFLEKHTFYNLISLVQLNLSACRIEYFPKETFYNLPKLEVLDISGNGDANTTSLSNLLLDIVNFPLKTLVMNNEVIFTLDRTFELFQPNMLEGLNLSNSLIQRIMPGTFQHFKDLRILDLSRNHISDFPFLLFENLTSLTHLYLQSNALWFFSTFHFGISSSSLTALYLQQNRLTTVTVEDLNLTTLDVSQNDVSTIYLTGLFSLTTLKISIKKLNRLVPLNFRRIPNLSHLAMSSDASIKLKPDFFSNNLNLETLELSGFKLMHLHPSKQKDLWGILNKLHDLRIRKCGLSILIPGMFSNLSVLETLDLSSNRIAFFEPSAFQNMTRLRTLVMESNMISYVTWESFRYLPHLRSLSLAFNPILCTCEVLWIYQIITTKNLVYVSNADNHFCQGPWDLIDVKVGDINLKVLDCEDNWANILKPVCSGFLVIMTILCIYAIWHYRWRIRYTFFLARAGIGRYEEFHDDYEYIYDAFVAYSSEDLPWVKQHLMFNIDVDYIGEDGFKLCVHDRDWLGGVDIVENIVKSIAESRRTILVLSKAFAISRWCQFELAMAHMRLDAEGKKRDRLVVILLDNIPNEMLTPRLVYLLTTKTYLKWSQDPDSQRIFWKALKKSLRRQVLYNQTGV